MKVWLMKVCSMLLTLVIMFNLLPHQAIALELEPAEASSVAEAITSENNAEAVDESATIVAEVTENRTRFSKEYKLSNGLNMAVVYPGAVHYEEDGQWKDIDNTLKAEGSGTAGVFKNTAGEWDVVFPQQLNNNNRISITKDGYTVSFGMAGEIRKIAQPVIDSKAQVTASIAGGMNANMIETVRQMKTASAQITELDYTLAKETAQHPEIVRDKLQSRLIYNDVYNNTNIIYDLDSYQLKESIVIDRFDASVQGYSYTLETGTLIPVLRDDGSVDLLAPDSDDVIMTMPAPYMIDAAGVTSTDVAVSLVSSVKGYILTYTMPMDWLAEADRQWPVVLDPIIHADTHWDNILDQFVAEYYTPPFTDGSLSCGYCQDFGKMRTFIQYVNLPPLTSADVVVHAELSLQYLDGGTENASVIEAHKVNSTWDSKTITWQNKPGHSDIVEDYAIVSADQRYNWDITDLVRDWYASENTGLMLKVPNSVEETTVEDYKKFYSIDYSNTEQAAPLWPYLSIVFRNSNGIEDYWDYTTSSAGRAGTGYVNNYSGNLTWVHSDIGFGGNRMPVTISHVYNAHDCGANAFGLGYGWRTNFNQLAYQWDADPDYYIWEDGDGTKHYFLHSEGSTYKDEDGLELTLTVSGNNKTITDKYGNTSYFDGDGYLYKLENNQATRSSIDITYRSADSNQISRITDGVGRVYNFIYNDSNLLTEISYVGKGSTELAYVRFGYSGLQLASIRGQDGRACYYSYADGNFLASVQDIDGYRLQYTYSTSSPKRVVGISEYDETTAGGSMTIEDDETTAGGSMTIEYAHNQTTFTDHNGNVQILQFNNWGNVTSIQDDQGRAQFAQYALDDTNPSDNSTGKGNQLTVSSKMQNTVSNLYSDSSFENGGAWSAIHPSKVSGHITTEEAYMGNKSLAMVREIDGALSGLYSPGFTIPAGKTYTFSAYVKTGTGTACLAIGDGTAFIYSDDLDADSDWTRMEVSYTNTTSVDKSITVGVQTRKAGTVYVDCVQLEKAPTASRYNLIQNGNFSASGSPAQNWTGTGLAASDVRTTHSAAAPQLDTNVMKIVGDPSSAKKIRQTIPVSGSEGDSYVISGWAQADSVPLRTDKEAREFGIRLIFDNTDGSKTTEIAQFNCDTNSTVNWQYSAVPAVADKAYSSITVELVYDHNANTAYFDGIQLFKEEFGSSYTYDANGNIKSVVDLQKQNTTYEYENNNLTKVISPSGIMTYTYDIYHNVETATTANGEVYKFYYDTYGNNIRVEITSGGKTIVSTADYSDDRNTLVSVTDALEKTTTYHYNEDTNVLEWVRYPNGTETTRTEYTYDGMFRLKTAAADVNTGRTLTASYSYTDDMLTSISTGSTTYRFTYGAFSHPNGVKIGNKTLVVYTYTTDRNQYLSALTYGNGDEIVYTYDKYGRVIQETYEDGASVTYTYDNTGTLATVMDSATGIKTTYHYDLTDRLVKYTEEGSDYSHQVTYTYDEKNNLASMSEVANRKINPQTYTYDDSNRLTRLTYGAGGKTYTYDGYGRLSQRGTFYFENTTIRENITYTEPEPGQTSYQIATWQNVSDFYNFTYTYTYDNNGNITAISDGTNTTSYVYDSANQLLRENNQAGGFTRVWTYDNAGNISSRKEYAYTTGALGTPTDTVTYTYDDDDWGDLLTAYDGETIEYDNVGNPISDGTWTYTWEHGRQLAGMTDGTTTISYTYNAEGLRIGKTVTRSNYSETHEYFYNNGNMTFDTITVVENGVTTDHSLKISYDESGRPLVITYNNRSYFYLLNAQGDVMGISGVYGDLKVAYTYDAWGNVLSVTGPLADTLGYWNPCRYRGYVYDNETQLYYLQSRYYNPEVGRFINADSTIAGTGGDILGYNMFSYCFNNPVNMSDSTGNWPKWLENAVKVVSVVVAVTAVVATVATVSAFTAGTGSAAAVYGATILLGAALSGINGGVANEAKGNSYTNGYVGGFTGGAIQATCSKTSTGTIIGGGVGVTVGTTVTDVMNNWDPDSTDSTAQEIATNAITSGGKALVTSSLTAYMGYASDLAANNGANGLMPTYTRGFGETVKAFFGWLDDALVYIWK